MASFGRRGFFRYVKDEHRPLPKEIFNRDDPRFGGAYMHEALRDWVRFYRTVRAFTDHVPPGTVRVVDLGVYPGTLLRVMRGFLPRYGYRISAYGVGLSFVSDFEDRMRAEGIELAKVNLDPARADLKPKGYPEEVPLPPASFDAAFATEILEHMVNPLHLLGQAFRLLKPGGRLFATTPNVTRIGSVFKLSVGRTNLDVLAPVGWSNSDDEWRPHVREYDIEELRDMLRRAGFEISEAVYFDSGNTRYVARPLSQRLVDMAKTPFYAVPHLRGNLLIVGRKP